MRKGPVFAAPFFLDQLRSTLLVALLAGLVLPALLLATLLPGLVLAALLLPALLLAALVLLAALLLVVLILVGIVHERLLRVGLHHGVKLVALPFVPVVSFDMVSCCFESELRSRIAIRQPNS